MYMIYCLFVDLSINISTPYARVHSNWVPDHRQPAVLSLLVLAVRRTANRVVLRVARLQHPDEAAHREYGPPMPMENALVQGVPQRLAIVNHLLLRSDR